METKEKLKLHQLSENERKDLFNKFIDAGGKVVDEKRSKGLNFDRERQKELVKQIKSKEKRLKDLSDINLFSDEELDQSLESLSAPGSLRDRFVIYIKGLFHGVCSLSGRKINKGFFNFLRSKVIPNLKNFDAIISYILSSDATTMAEIKKNLDKKSPYYNALLSKFDHIYNEEEFKSVFYFFNRSGVYDVRPKHIEEPVKNIIRRFYVLQGYYNGSYNAIKTALSVVTKRKGWSKAVYQRRVAQVKFSLHLIFSVFYPKLHTILLLILQDNLPFRSRKMERYLDIRETDKVEYLIEKQEQQFTSRLPSILPELKKTIEEKEIEYIKKSFRDLTDDDLKNLELDEFLIYGIKMNQAVDINKIIADNRDLFLLDKLSNDDKIMYVFIYLKEFEKEYSFILTSYKIMIKPLFEENKRVDYKDKLNALYLPLTSLYESIKIYLDTMKALNDINEDKTMNDISRYNRTTSLDGKRSKLNFEIRTETMKYFLDIKQYFDKFANDYNQEKKIIENPEDLLHFNKDVEGEKKVEGKRIIDAIMEADAFITGFLFRLEEGGDLSGISPLIREIDVPEVKIVEKEVEPEEGKSFLDELEDTLQDK